MSYKPLHLEAQQRLQEEGCVVDIIAVTASGLDHYPPRVGDGEAAGCCVWPPSASACAGDAWSAAAAPPICASLCKGPRSRPLRRGSWACCFPHGQRPHSLRHWWLGGAHPSSPFSINSPPLFSVRCRPTAVRRGEGMVSPTGAHHVAPLHSAVGRREGASAGRSCDHFQVAIHMHSFCPNGVHGIQVAVHVRVRRADGVHFC